MVKRYEIPDASWKLVADLFEQPRRSGRPRADNRLCSMACSGCFAQALHGATCPSASDPGQRSTSGFEIGITKEGST